MSVASDVTLILASALAAFEPGDSLLTVMLALALLAIDWKFELISGTTKVIDSTQQSQRTKIQGKVDMLIVLSGASDGALSGMIAAGPSYAVLSMADGFLSLLLITIILWSENGAKKKSYS